MSIKIFKLIATAFITVSCIGLIPAHADNLYTSKTRPRNVDDSVGVQKLFGVPALAFGENGANGSRGLGNRIINFAVGSGGGAYVRAVTCLLSATASNDNRNSPSVNIIGGPYSDGTYIYSLSNPGGSEDPIKMNCYFDGTAGYTTAAPFQNYENLTSSNYRSCSGNYCTTATSSNQLDFVTGQNKTLGTSNNGYAYTPCEVDENSGACRAAGPTPESCAASGYDYSPFDPNTGAYRPNTGGSCSTYTPPTPYCNGGGEC